MRNALFLASALMLFSTGCVLRVPGAAYRPAPQRMTRNEAVDAAFAECRSRRLDCRLQESHLKRGGDVWRVKMRAYAPGRKGHLHLDYDAWSRALVRADAKIRPWRRKGPPRWDVDDDWDDDNDGVADWKDRRNNSRHHRASSPGKSDEKRAAPPGHQKKAHDDDDDDDDDDDRDDRDDKSSAKDSRKN